MFGRRSHVRMNLTRPSDGMLRILHEVVVLRGSTAGELVAISRESAIVGEPLTLDITSREASLVLPVQVQEVRPVMVDGTLRHRLVLERLEPATMAGAHGAGLGRPAQDGDDDRVG
jgi:hypothetical protein